ncbi:MAG TPA: 6,7-dimethyl-8-ribityllumazine synthase [Acidimicrobiia bacterium]|jgi:6,7-dimethyl-8-ribityllumazine synthase|nr:6,7-dimethyl-8-ribityllumazine synthase [Acidimicrobiia bacterium]
MPTYEGRLDATGLRIGLLASRFNETITKSLLDGALSALRRHGLDDASITVAWVPGAFELPLASKRLAASGDFDAIVCLGAVIRGATAHFDFVAGQSAAGVARASFDTGIPIIFGVLTTENIEQAIERSGTKAGNKGFDSAVAAIEMADLLRQLPKGQGQ